MTESTALTLLWMILTLGLGLMLGWLLGDEVRRRKHAEEQVEELREQLRRTAALPADPLRQIRGVLNDTHRRLCAVTKALEKRPL